MASRNASFHEVGIVGALLAPLKLVFALTLVFIGIFILAWIVDWTFEFKVWPDGIDQLKGILAADLARARDLARWQGAVPGAVTGTANFLYGVVFRFTGIHDMGMRFAECAALSIPDTIVRDTYLANIEAIEVAMIGTQLLGVRLAMLAFMVPLLVLTHLVAATDGLTQRAIRRACGGRESASLYHRAKYLQVALIGIGLPLFLVFPSPMDVHATETVLAALVLCLVRVQWAYYKKHL